MPLGVEVLIDQETLRRMVLSSLDYYTHHIAPHTISPKMTKLSSKLNLTKLFYISPQQDLYPPLKKCYFPIAQETIIITTQPVNMTRKLPQS